MVPDPVADSEADWVPDPVNDADLVVLFVRLMVFVVDLVPVTLTVAENDTVIDILSVMEGVVNREGVVEGLPDHDTESVALVVTLGEGDALIACESVTVLEVEGDTLGVGFTEACKARGRDAGTSAPSVQSPKVPHASISSKKRWSMEEEGGRTSTHTRARGADP